ncbi:hypothetical protein OS493_012823 [Desmophyllum pertusum]|uniref:Uncharacterized protein n=1 Tax=Desmophyllum pertusum TaxID=174260 RepID=A0A9W9Z1C9_9CNID|nr:hypothetical protein OS493_012823 [Desmophyllum pertusum]
MPTKLQNIVNAGSKLIVNEPGAKDNSRPQSKENNYYLKEDRNYSRKLKIRGTGDWNIKGNTGKWEHSPCYQQNNQAICIYHYLGGHKVALFISAIEVGLSRSGRWSHLMNGAIYNTNCIWETG